MKTDLINNLVSEMDPILGGEHKMHKMAAADFVNWIAKQQKSSRTKTLNFPDLHRIHPKRKGLGKRISRWLGQGKEHSPLGEGSLYGWSPVLKGCIRLLHKIQTKLYFLHWSVPVLLNWRPAIQ